LTGPWSLDYQGARPTATTRHQTQLQAKNVYIVAGGTGTLTVTRNGKPTTVPISGPPTSHQIVAGDRVVPGR